jgi:hypothetical protein
MSIEPHPIRNMIPDHSCKNCRYPDKGCLRYMALTTCDEFQPNDNALYAELSRLREEAQQAAVAVAWAYQTEEEEYQRFQKLLASLEEDCEPSAGYVSEMLEHITTLRSRLRSSPAPVVGGVPELTRDDLDSACEWQNTGEPLDLSATVANLNKLIASRLPALKPGVVEIPEPTGIVVDLPERYREKGVELVRQAIQWARENAKAHPHREGDGP